MAHVWVRNHEGLEHDLLMRLQGLWRRLIEHAWFQMIGQSTSAFEVSWLEIVFMLHVSKLIEYPVSGSSGKLIAFEGQPFRSVPPTAASRLSLVICAMNLTPRPGNYWYRCYSRLMVELLGGARDLLIAFCSGRKVESHQALARPL